MDPHWCPFCKCLKETFGQKKFGRCACLWIFSFILVTVVSKGNSTESNWNWFKVFEDVLPLIRASFINSWSSAWTGHGWLAGVETQEFNLCEGFHGASDVKWSHICGRPVIVIGSSEEMKERHYRWETGGVADLPLCLGMVFPISYRWVLSLL